MKKSTSRLGRGLRSLVPDLRDRDGLGSDRTGAVPQQHSADAPPEDKRSPAGEGPVSQRDAVESPTNIESETSRQMEIVSGSKADLAPVSTSWQEPPEAVSTGEYVKMPIGDLRPNPHQPRSDFDESTVLQLADSIAANGLLQPIVARRADSGFEILAGERRWRAAKLAKLDTVPVLVRKATNEQMLELALVENIQREDLNAIDRAEAYRRYCDAFGHTAEQVAERVGEDRTTVVNYLRLLDLPHEVRVMVADRAITMGHARSIAGVRDRNRQAELARLVQRDGISVRGLEQIIRGEKQTRGLPRDRERATIDRTPNHIRDLERRFEEVLATKVRITTKRGDAGGRILVEFYGVDDFERIAKIIGVAS